MRDLLPEVVAVEVATDEDWTGDLLPEEAAALSEKAVPGRRREFTAGRVCARRAMRRLGLPEAPVLSAKGRAPIWPSAVVGSITHTAGYCAAAVARSTDVLSVGLDAERRTVLPPEIVSMICLPEEAAWCAARPDEPWWPAVHFSAKETVYKLWSPVVGVWLDFLDAHLTVDVAAGTFEARISAAKLADSPAVAPGVLTGRFTVEPDLIRTAGILLPG